MIINRYKKSLLSLFDRVKVLSSNPSDLNNLFIIQKILIKKIIYIEKRIKSLQIQRKEYKKILSQKSSDHKITKYDIVFTENIISEYKNIKYLYKNIGDSLAWIYIARHDIKPMAFHEDTGFISGNKGLRRELKLFRDLSKIFPVIFADATNVLRYGDIVIIHHEIPIPIEVKTKLHQSSQHKRQLSKLKELSNYIATDKTSSFFNDGALRLRIDIQLKEEYYNETINNLLTNYQGNINNFIKIEDGLFAYIFTSNNISDSINDLPEGNFISIPTSFDRFDMNHYKPFILSIDNIRALYDIYSGFLHIIIFLDKDVLISKLKSKNIETTILDSGEYFIEIKSSQMINGPISRISYVYFFRIAYEFLSLSWLINELSYKLDNLSNSLELLQSGD